MKMLSLCLISGLLVLANLTPASADCSDYRLTGYGVPSYSCPTAWHYDCAGWWNGRWWPAGWYCYYNGCNYLRGYGRCYGWFCPEAYYSR